MVFLNCVICQMNKSVRQVLHVKLFTGCSNVSILEPIALHAAVYRGHQDIGPDVEFSLLIQKRDNVLLNNMGPLLSLFAFGIFLDNAVDLFKGLNHNNAISSVCILSGLDQPSISSFGLEAILDLIVGTDFFILLFLLDFLISFVVFL